ncbi:helix-turn-helix domain-containing protein [Chloroflexia bacterium SDU3-3]|nr:helix-turn-helix domain-containing protein [Chloroflexia bacterium SDU3-3]
MAIQSLDLERQHELATFLRSRRARVAPEQAGFARGLRRRTPGLRREEVALLVGVSTEWYTWLEQGRDINVSVQVLERLASVLRLDASERDHLFLLALRQPAPVETFAPPTVSPMVQQFLDHLGAAPAGAVDARMNVVACNDAYRLTFVVRDATNERERNLIWRLFSEHGQRNNLEWAELARVYLAQFRVGYGRFIGDPWWAEMIADLSEISPMFRELWPRHEVGDVSEGRKTMRNAQVGVLHFDFLWLQAVGSSDLRLLIHTPRPGTGTAEKIEQLLAAAREPAARR